MFVDVALQHPSTFVIDQLYDPWHHNYIVICYYKDFTVLDLLHYMITIHLICMWVIAVVYNYMQITYKLCSSMSIITVHMHVVFTETIGFRN